MPTVNVTTHAARRAIQRLLPGATIVEAKSFLRWVFYNARDLTRAERLSVRGWKKRATIRTIDLSIDGRRVFIVVDFDRYHPYAMVIVTCLTTTDAEIASNVKRRGRRPRS